MSYLKSDSTNGLPSINSSRGLLGDPSIRRSLTRLDDLDASSRHVSFRSTSPTFQQQSYSGESRGIRSASPVRSRSPVRDSTSALRSRSRSRSPTRDYSPSRQNRIVTEVGTQFASRRRLCLVHYNTVYFICTFIF